MGEHPTPQNPPDVNTVAFGRLFVGHSFSPEGLKNRRGNHCGKGSAIFQIQPVSQKGLLPPGLHLHSTQTCVVGLADDKHQLLFSISIKITGFHLFQCFSHQNWEQLQSVSRAGRDEDVYDAVCLTGKYFQVKESSSHLSCGLLSTKSQAAWICQSNNF